MILLGMSFYHMQSGDDSMMFPYADVDGSRHDAFDHVDLKLTSLESCHMSDVLDSGDPYRELDDTTRGVPIGQPTSLHAFPFDISDKSGFLSDNDPRGSFFHTGEGGKYSLPGNCSESDPIFLPSLRDASVPWWEVPNTNISCSAISDFQEHHIPPSTPSSKYFFFASTTLIVEGCSPQLIGKSVVDFLTTEVIASVTKVRPLKYSIKAEVFVEGVSCNMKVKVYSHDGKYAVEVQRQAGDAFVMQSTYRLLFAYLDVRCGSVSAQCGTAVPLAQRMSIEFEPVEEDEEMHSPESIAPQLEMATVTGLQSEAASALAKTVKGARISAAQLLKAPDQVASALTGLLATGCRDTVYPAACCVSDLAGLGQAHSILAHDGLLQTMALQAIAELKTSQGLVGTRLAQAVQIAVQCCVGSLTLRVSRELQQILDDAMKDKILQRNVAAHRHLEQAWLDTRLVA